jgi:hypothetical protein
MMIKSYSFGSMILGDRRYTSDLIIFPDGRITDNWWRTQGHRLGVEDLPEMTPVDAVVVGTGYNGLMTVPEETRTNLGKLSKTVIVSDTRQAVKKFNALSGKKRVLGLFHLTC